jgi:hypothetical protein
MRRLIIALLLVVSVLLYGCSSVAVKDINDDPGRYLGKKVSVSGKVVAPIQLGQLSGFTLKDDGSSIMVSSDMVPKADSDVVVKGTVVKGLFTQHYIFAEDVSVR